MASTSASNGKGLAGLRSDKSVEGGSNFYGIVKGLSAHGGSMFKSLDEEVPLKHVSAQKASWTVHDGQFFAENVSKMKPRAPAERRFLARETSIHGMHLKPLERQRLREIGLKPSDVARMGERNFRIFQEASVHGGSMGDDHTPPPALSDLGGTIVAIRDFTMKDLLGLGSFSSVHTAKWAKTGQTVALKIFFHPVHKPGDGSGRAANPTDPNAVGAAGNGGSRNRVGPWTSEESRAPDPRLRQVADYDARDAESFAQEVALLATAHLAHSQIVKYLGHGFVQTPDGLAGFIVTELLEGDDLYTTLLRHRKGSRIVSLADAAGIGGGGANGDGGGLQPASPGRLPIATALKWAREICSAMAHLHKHGVVHRDIKETNVMISPTRGATLIDLGCAMQGQPGGTYNHQLAFRFGVKGYRAPEVNRNKRYGDAVDVFAFGRVLYNMLCAVEPPKKDVRNRALKARMVDAVSEVLPSCLLSRRTACWAYDVLFCEPPFGSSWPRDLVELTQGCIHSDPARRPAAKEIARQLDEAAASAPPSPPSSGPPTLRPPVQSC